MSKKIYSLDQRLEVGARILSATKTRTLPHTAEP